MQRVQFKQHFLHPKHWPLWLGLGVGWLIAQLPYRLLLALGRVVGALMYRVAHDRRHIVETNLALCFPGLSPAEREQLCPRQLCLHRHGVGGNGYGVVVA